MADRSTAPAAFKALEVRCQELARRRTHWATREELAGGLEHDGFVLGPDPLHSADVRTLRESSRSRVAVLRDEARIRAAAELVRLERDVFPLVTGSDGNLALVGPAGAGKTAVALQAAYALTESGADVLFLTGDTLAVTAGEARAQLGIKADLADVMLAWRGSGPATLIIDGLDITRLSDSSRWLLELVRRLSGSRWRVLATVRSYSLRHGPDWQEVFRGDPVDPLRRDPSLARVRHLQVSDLTDGELAPLLSASPQLAGLFTCGRPALIQLLHNPYNVRIAADLLVGDPAMRLDSISTQHDLLSAYWDRRVSGTPDYPSRQRILTDLTGDMIASRRPRVADPATALDPSLLPYLPGLLADDVLREDPKVRWSAAAAVGYSHPILFDFAVAQLMLGRPGDPMHLLDALNADPDLSVIVRPSLDFHFSALWQGEPGHETFWSLAVRLDEGAKGHVLASLAAAATCLRDGLSPGDLDFLIAACQGRGPMGTSRDDARRLLMLIAGVMPTPDIPPARRRAAVPVIATAAAQLAAAAEASKDIDLARLVTVVLHRLRTAVEADPVPAATADRDSAAAAVMRLALTDPPAAGRADLASRSAGLVADAIIDDPVSYAGLADQISDAATMNAWGMRPALELLWQMPAIGAAVPGHARRLVLSVWDFEVTDDGPESIGSSQILSFSTTKAREVDQARWEIGNQFPAWLAAAPGGAVDAFLELIRRSAPPWPSRVKIADGHPSVRRSQPLMSGKGYDTLREMTGSLASHLKSAFTRSAAGQGASGVVPQILDQLAKGLVHDEVWNTLLAAGASTGSCQGCSQARAVVIRRPDVPHLALLNELLISAEGLFDWRMGVVQVGLVEVDVIGLQAAQGILGCARDVGGR